MHQKKKYLMLFFSSKKLFQKKFAKKFFFLKIHLDFLGSKESAGAQRRRDDQVLGSSAGPRACWDRRRRSVGAWSAEGLRWRRLAVWRRRGLGKAGAAIGVYCCWEPDWDRWHSRGCWGRAGHRAPQEARASTKTLRPHQKVDRGRNEKMAGLEWDTYGCIRGVQNWFYTKNSEKKPKAPPSEGDRKLKSREKILESLGVEISFFLEVHHVINIYLMNNYITFSEH